MVVLFFELSSTLPIKELKKLFFYLVRNSTSQPDQESGHATFRPLFNAGNHMTGRIADIAITNPSARRVKTVFLTLPSPYSGSATNLCNRYIIYFK